MHSLAQLGRPRALLGTLRLPTDMPSMLLGFCIYALQFPCHHASREHKNARMSAKPQEAAASVRVRHELERFVLRVEVVWREHFVHNRISDVTRVRHRFAVLPVPRMVVRVEIVDIVSAGTCALPGLRLAPGMRLPEPDEPIPSCRVMLVAFRL